MPFRELKPHEWLEEIEYGLQYRRQYGLEDMWGQLEAIYYNVHESRLNDGPNIILSQGDAMLSSVTVPNPYLMVHPDDPESVPKAPYLENLDNKFLRVLDIPGEIEHAVLAAYLFGRGFIKWGYDSEWGYDPSLDFGGALRLGLTLTQLDRTGKRRIEHNANISPGMPWGRSVDPRDVIVPWGIRDLESSPWIAHRLIRQIDDLKADSKYENTKRLTGQMSMEDFVNSYKSTIKTLRTSNTRDPEYVELYEIQDRRTGKIYVITPDHDSFLRNEENALQIENHLPWTSLAFTPITRNFWTTPDAWYLYHVQKELSDVAVQRTKQRRISVLKFLYDEDLIDELELEKILSPDVGVGAKVKKGMARDLKSAIELFQIPPNLQLAQEEDLLRANAREQIGFSRNQLGEYTGGRKTATEVGAVERSSQLRMSRRGLRVKRAYEQNIEVMNRIIFEHWTIGQYVETMGQASGTAFAHLNGPMLKGHYHYKVDFGTEQENESSKIQALQLYTLMSQDPAVDPIALREFLSNHFNDPRFARIFNADVRARMSAMQVAGGDLQSQGSGSQQPRAPQLPTMQGRQNGQARLSAPA